MNLPTEEESEIAAARTVALFTCYVDNLIWQQRPLNPIDLIEDLKGLWVALITRQAAEILIKKALEELRAREDGFDG